MAGDLAIGPHFGPFWSGFEFEGLEILPETIVKTKSDEIENTPEATNSEPLTATTDATVTPETFEAVKAPEANLETVSEVTSATPAVWIVAGSAAVLLIAAGIVALVLAKKKKKA